MNYFWGQLGPMDQLVEYFFILGPQEQKASDASGLKKIILHLYVPSLIAIQTVSFGYIYFGLSVLNQY